MKNHNIPGLLVLILILLTSCHDIETKSMDSTDAQTLLSESVIAYGIFSTTQEEATRTGLSFSITKSAQISTDEYPQITVDPLDLTWPKTITIDYGPENITGIDGRERRGVMIFVAQNFPNVDNATWVISFDEFYIDDYLVEGIQTVKYTGTNSSGYPEYECTVTNGRITNPDGKSFYFEQQTTREWISGYDTYYILSGDQEDLCDDNYQITGEHSGISSEGYTYTVTTKEPLLVNACCRYIEDGKLTVELQDANVNCEIDYRPGNDTGELCNNLATFNIFGNTITINL